MGDRVSHSRPFARHERYDPAQDTETANVLVGCRPGAGAARVSLVCGLLPNGRFMLSRCGAWEQAVNGEGFPVGVMVRCRPGRFYCLHRWDGSHYWFVVRRGVVAAVDERVAAEAARLMKGGA